MAAGLLECNINTNLVFQADIVRWYSHHEMGWSSIKLASLLEMAMLAGLLHPEWLEPHAQVVGHF
jgi:hypothetical protein